MLFSIRKVYNRKKLLQLLNTLEGAEEPAISVYLPQELSGSDLDKVQKLLLENRSIPDEVFKVAAESKTGSVIFWGENKRYLVVPPFPMNERITVFGYEVENLRHLLEKELTIAVVFIRFGLYGIGLFEGNVLIASKVGTGLVHGRHKKGGSSQHRFERHRDKQIEYFFTNVCQRSRDKLEPYLKQIDYLFYCGERHTVDDFIKQCDFLQQLNNRVMPRLIDVRGHGQQALTEAIDKIWSGTVFEWREQDETSGPVY
jgi:hypothetical protein